MDRYKHKRSAADLGLIGQIFRPQADALHQAQTGAVQEVGHEAMAPFQAGQHGAHLGGGEDDGQAGGTLGPFHIAQPADVLFQYFLVQEQDSAQCLILGGSGDVALHGQVGQELLDLRFAHFLGVALAVKQDVALDPVHVGLLGADAVVLEADFCANLIEQRGLDMHNRRYFNVFHGRRPVSVTGESRNAGTEGDAVDKPIGVVARIQLVRFNNKLVKAYRDYTSKLA